MDLKMPIKKRDSSIDNIRGIAIVLVVIGHVIVEFYETDAAFVDNYWFRLIYSFHMPLFMFVGGWVAWLTFDGTFKKLKKRTAALLIPFVVWNVIDFVYKITVNGSLPEKYAYYTLTGQGYLWFFYSMLLCYVLLYLLLKLPKKWQLIAALGVCGVMLVAPKFFQLGLIHWYFFFFIAGYFVSQYQRLNPIKNSWGVALGLCALGVAMSSVWHPDGTADWAFVAQSKYLLFVWRYAVPLVWIAGIFALFYKIGPLADRVGQTLGRYTMEIYIQNYAWICLAVMVWNYEPLYWLETILITALTLYASIVLAKWVERSPKLGFWLLGKQ